MTGRGKKGRQRRAEIVGAAERLFYRQGVASTSFSDLAELSDVPRGNFYFHFQDKLSIVEAVIDHRVGELEGLIQKLDREHADPRRRLQGFVDNLVARAEQVSRYGCPVGSMVDELAKGEADPVSATRLFELLRCWMTTQLRALGLPRNQADPAAVELLCRTQGINVMATAFADPKLVRQQVRRIKSWLEQLCPPKR